VNLTKLEMENLVKTKKTEKNLLSLQSLNCKEPPIPLVPKIKVPRT
jgi:hypothetical protein